MTIKTTKHGGGATLALFGRLDTNTAPRLESELPEIAGSGMLTFDFAGVEYISSAGLRVLLAALNKVEESGGFMRLVNVCSDVMEIFEMTGFADVLTIENP